LPKGNIFIEEVMPFTPERETSPRSNEEGLQTEEFVTLQFKDENVLANRLFGDFTSMIAFEFDKESPYIKDGEGWREFMDNGGRIFLTVNNTYLCVRSEAGDYSYPGGVKEVGRSEVVGEQSYRKIPGKKVKISSNRVSGDINQRLSDRISGKGLRLLGLEDEAQFVESGGIVILTENKGRVYIIPEGLDLDFPIRYR
jgi:hypothetical protein